MRTLAITLQTLGALSFLSLAAVLAAGILGTVSGILSTEEGGALWAFAFTHSLAFGAAELCGILLFIAGKCFARIGE